MSSLCIELQPVHPADGSRVYSAWGHDPANFQRTTASVFRSVADAQHFVGQLLAGGENLAFHLITANGDTVGLVKAKIEGHRAQVGYIVDRAHWGRGFATEAVRQLVQRLEEMPAISRIWATCALDNPGSIRVLEKCGFEREAILRRWVIFPALSPHAVDNYSYVLPPKSP